MLSADWSKITILESQWHTNNELGPCAIVSLNIALTQFQSHCDTINAFWFTVDSKFYLGDSTDLHLYLNMNQDILSASINLIQRFARK